MAKITVEDEEGKKEYEFETFVVVGEAVGEITRDGNLCRQVVTHKAGNLAKALGVLEIAKRAILNEDMRQKHDTPHSIRLHRHYSRTAGSTTGENEGGHPLAVDGPQGR